MEIKAGDIVKIKSGGPKMIVEDIGQYTGYSNGQQARCVWFEGTKNFEHIFELTSLRLIRGTSEED